MCAVKPFPPFHRTAGDVRAYLNPPEARKRSGFVLIYAKREPTARTFRDPSPIILPLLLSVKPHLGGPINSRSAQRPYPENIFYPIGRRDFSVVIPTEGEVACPVSSFLFFNGPPAAVTPVAETDRVRSERNEISIVSSYPTLGQVLWNAS